MAFKTTYSTVSLHLSESIVSSGSRTICKKTWSRFCHGFSVAYGLINSWFDDLIEVWLGMFSVCSLMASQGVARAPESFAMVPDQPAAGQNWVQKPFELTCQSNPQTGAQLRTLYVVRMLVQVGATSWLASESSWKMTLQIIHCMRCSPNVQ